MKNGKLFIGVDRGAGERTCVERAGDLENWPNCSVADCEYKACLSAESDKCHAHTFGLPLVPFAEYIKEDDDDGGR
jgi:hypothetical protein